jgi:hypothetical protein
MMRNVLVFFKHYIINGEHEEDDEVFLMKKLSKERRKNKEHEFFNYSEIS